MASWQLTPRFPHGIAAGPPQDRPPLVASVDLPEDGREAGRARCPPAASWTSSTATGQWVGRGFYNGHSRIALRVLTADPGRGHRRRLLRPQDRRGRRPAPRLARARRRHRRLPAGPFRGRRPERAGRRSLRRRRWCWSSSPPACSASAHAIQDALATHFPDAASTGSPRSTSRSRSRSTAAPPEPPPPDVITEHGVRFRVAPGSKHKTGFFLDQRDNRRLLAEFCDGQARPRPVLQHRRLRGLRQGAGQGGGGRRRRPGRAGHRPGQAERQPEPGPRPLRAGRPVPLAARRHRRRASASTWWSSTRPSRRATARRSTSP